MLVRRKMGKIESSVKQLVAPIAAECDCTVVDVEYKKQPDGMHLFVFIDKKGGVTIDDCEKVHMAIDQPLDEQPSNCRLQLANWLTFTPFQKSTVKKSLLEQR